MAFQPNCFAFIAVRYSRKKEKDILPIVDQVNTIYAVCCTLINRAIHSLKNVYVVCANLDLLNRQTAIRLSNYLIFSKLKNLPSSTTNDLFSFL